jgi:signal peptidase I
MRKKILILSLLLVVLGVIALIGYRVFFLKMVEVPTGAMANTIIPGDHLVVKRLFGEVKRGDIVVFRYPNQPSIQYIARVVGLQRDSRSSWCARVHRRTSDSRTTSPGETRIRP